MPSTIGDLYELPRHGENSARPDAAVVHGVSVLLSGTPSLGRRPELSDARPSRRPEADDPPAAGAAEPEEILIQDVRGRLTPAQMVEHKVLALLRQARPAGTRHETDATGDPPRGAGRRTQTFRP
jgi:hypothetical protein